MAIGTNDAVVKSGTQKTLEANGASTADAAYTQANDASYVRVTDGSDAPDAKFALSVTFSVAPAAGKHIILFARALNFDGTNDAPVPSANYEASFVASFMVSPVTSLQYVEAVGYDLPADCDLYIRNDAGQTISAGWTLKITPQTLGPAT